jgi:photosystem II stability/assembly factor-like uncharacterized protein
MFDFKALLEDIWPDNKFGDLDPDEDLAKLFEGMAEDYQAAYDQVQLIAHIRNPRLTGDLPDLEREYGIIPDVSLETATRRQMLAHIMYRRPTTASWEHLQNALIEAGFTNLLVTPNNPVTDPETPSLVGGDLLVNGTLYTSQSPAYYMAAGSDIAYAGHSKGYTGYFIKTDRIEKTYTIPDEVSAYWTWRYLFWVGGTASGFGGSSAEVAIATIDPQRETQLKNLILKYKPAFTWAVLKLNFKTALSGSATNGKIFRSTDDGLTWSDLGQQASATRIYSLTYTSNGIFLAGTSSNGKILRSTDYGVTWSDLGQQASETDIQSLTYLENGICLAGTSPNGKIFRSTNYGVTWSDLGQQASESVIFSFSYVGDGVCLAGSGTGGKIFRSTDYGATWSDLGQQASETRIFSLLHVGDGVCLAGSYPNGKIFRSTDYGATWSDLGQQASETSIYSFAYTDFGICLAGSGPTGKIFFSGNYGATWSDLGQQASETAIYTLKYLKNGICLAGTGANGKILRSTDYGIIWSDLGQQASETAIHSLTAM